MPEGHRLLKKSKVRLKDLKDEPFVLLDTKPAREYFLDLFAKAGFAPRTEYMSPSFEAIRGLVARGLGYLILVTRPKSDVTYDGLPIHHRPLADSVSRLGICLVRMPLPRITRLCETFQNVSLELFSKPAP